MQSKASHPEHAAGDRGKGEVALNPQVEKAVVELRRAIHGKDVDAVCNAYLALREVGRGMNVEKLLTSAASSAGAAVVTGFAARRCFMCEDGTVPCEQCDGQGRTDDDRSCVRCDGLAVTACGFCAGVGWSDASVIPGEVVQAVRKRQLAMVRKDLQRLGTAVANLTGARIRRLPSEQRISLAAWLIRLQARLAELAKADGTPEKEADRFTTAVDKIDSCLDVLRNCGQ